MSRSLTDAERRLGHELADGVLNAVHWGDGMADAVSKISLALANGYDSGVAARDAEWNKALDAMRWFDDDPQDTPESIVKAFRGMRDFYQAKEEVLLDRIAELEAK